MQTEMQGSVVGNIAGKVAFRLMAWLGVSALAGLLAGAGGYCAKMRHSVKARGRDFGLGV